MCARLFTSPTDWSRREIIREKKGAASRHARGADEGRGRNGTGTEAQDRGDRTRETEFDAGREDNNEEREERNGPAVAAGLLLILRLLRPHLLLPPPPAPQGRLRRERVQGS